MSHAIMRLSCYEWINMPARTHAANTAVAETAAESSATASSRGWEGTTKRSAAPNLPSASRLLLLQVSSEWIINCSFLLVSMSLSVACRGRQGRGSSHRFSPNSSDVPCSVRTKIRKITEKTSRRGLLVWHSICLSIFLCMYVLRISNN